jgi:hypothetical protein
MQGKQHGVGKMYAANGEFKSGKWHNGNNVEWYDAPVSNVNPNGNFQAGGNTNTYPARNMKGD